MPKSMGQKRKLISLMRILQEQTDEEHPMTVAQMITELERQGIQAERKSLYDDLDTLALCGLDIGRRGPRGSEYFVGDRLFELPELKLLVDVVQSSKFITEKKSHELIKKLESLSSVYQARLLQRQVTVANRVKTMNESIYYNIDTIHEGISAGKQISFLYFEYRPDKLRAYRHNGNRYRVSPYALTYDDENYYLVAYDADAGIIKHYRVDKMSSLAVEKQNRLGAEEFGRLDIGAYSRKLFGMFGGRETEVKLRFDNGLAGVVIDRFGKELIFDREPDGHFCIKTPVQVSPQFFAWVFGLGDGVEIVSPPEIRRAFCERARAMLALYDARE